MNNSVFIKNRENLINQIDDDSILIAFAGHAPKKTGDELYQFTQNRNFYYLTGIVEPHHIVVLSKIKGKVTEKLFLKEINLDEEMWNGKTLRDTEGKDISGIKEVVYMNDFYSYLNSQIKGTEQINLYLDLDKENIEEDDSEALKFSKEMRNKYP